MSIENISGRVRPPMSAGVANKVEPENTAKIATKQAEKTDSVAITAMAKGIKKSLESASSANIVDVERVTAVKKALAEGSYKVNPEKIAEKMMQHEKLMSKLDHSR